MKPLTSILFILLIGFSISSCSNIRPIMDDNVYVMNSAIVPAGEDLVDETSYATFKHRQETNNPTNGYYSSLYQTAIFVNPMINSSSWFYYGPWNNFGTLTGSFNPYWGAHRNGYYGIDMIPGMSGYSQYWGYGAYQYYYPYNSNYGAWGSVYGLNNCNNGFYNSGFNGNNTFNSNVTNSGLFTSGPRATVSGYYSGNNRGGTVQVKSAQTITNSSPYNSFNRTNSSQRDNAFDSRGSSAQRPIYSRPTSRNEGGTQNSVRGGSREEYSTSSSSNGGIRMPRSNSSGTISSPRSGNSNSGSGSSTSGGSRSSSPSRPGGRGQ